jgi:hypothetical protein
VEHGGLCAFGCGRTATTVLTNGKGYVSEQAQAKFDAFPHPLIIVQKRNLQFVFDYVVGKYGKDFVRLYE